jgi:ABC-type glycerol-3-phosphate transport system permease component
VIWKIIFPIMLPGIVATATYAFLLCWSEYLFALAFLTDTSKKTMPLLLAGYFGENVVEWGNVMAGAVLTTLPTLLLFLPLQARMTSGLAAGSVKQ